MSLESIEKKIKSLEHEIVRLQAVNEIQNLMGRYEVVHNYTEGPKMCELFAQHTPDTWLEISDGGVCEGIENIKNMSNPVGKDPRGVIFEHHLTTPIIIVAKDGKTAKGIWWSPGHEPGERDGKTRSCWCWGRYAGDFVKEDGEWKIWHLKWFRSFKSPVTIDWRDRDMELEFSKKKNPWTTKPSRYHKPYSPESIQESIPPAPKPYDTWTEKENDWQFRPSEHP